MRMTFAAAALAAALAALAAEAREAPRITVVPDPVAPRVDVLIDGKPFTAYQYPRDWKKPALYPVQTASGLAITRGWPIEPRAGERADHPHHVGLWFNYGDVNGLDFWNNSDAVGPDRAPKMGTVVHKRVIEASSGTDQGTLNVEMSWVDPAGTALLNENTRFIFHGDGTSRTIDRITRLTALKTRVVLGDNKEGLIGLRVARALEQPSKAAVVLTDASGKPQPRTVNNDGVTGEYLASNGRTGDAVWGTRGEWARLAGTIEGTPVTVAILDHPSNPGFPTYWHARGYGLFAANNLGRQVFDPEQPEAKLTLEPGESVTFRHRILILEEEAGAARLKAEHSRFASGKP